MAIPHLDDEQTRTWTREQKDRWWLDHVYRGDMPQLTLRAAATGFLLGGVLAATNLYVGAKTGWSLGVGVTSVVLAYALFQVLGRLRLGGAPFTILENNAVQSVATSAGYMTAPLISSLTAYMCMTNQIMPSWQIFLWMCTASVLGVLLAFPMKRRFINDEQQPFPEGRACAVVLDSLYPDAPPGGAIAAGGDAAEGRAVTDHERWLGALKAKALFGAAAVAATIEFLKLEGYQTLLQVKLLGLGAEPIARFPERFFGWYYTLAEARGWGIPRILGTDVRQLAIDPTIDLTMFGAGGLTGVRTASSLLIGCLVNWFFLAPLMIWLGEVHPNPATGGFGRGYLLNSWCLWWGVAIMVTGSLTSLFAKPEMLLSAFRGLRRGASSADDPVAHIELPLWMSIVGVPVVSGVAVFLNWWWFGINPLLGFLAVPLLMLLTLIAANATALTSTTPTGSLSKITQFTFGALDRTNPATNLITAGMTAEAASNASNLLMDIKPGYMLGAKPRQQAIGHLIGIVSGGLSATVLYFALFLPRYDPAQPLADQVLSKYPFPAVDLWRGVAQLIASGGHDLATSALIAMGIAAVLGVVLELARARYQVPISPVAIGLGVVIPVDSTLMMFAGALFFAWMHRRARERAEGTLSRGLWVDSQEPLAAGIVAGAALTGIGDQLITVFVLGGG